MPLARPYPHRLLAVVSAILLGSCAAAQPPPAMAIGTNLASIRDWSTANPFVDAMKSSRPWLSGAPGVWQDQRPLDLDAHGWVRSLQPGQIARTLMFWDRPNTYPAGRYVVDYKGRGTLAYEGAWRRTGGAAGRDELEVDPSRGGLALSITATDPTDYLRDIHVTTAGAGAEPLFHPLFLDSLRGYRCLRFMNWAEQNLTQGDARLAAQPKTWADRPTVEDARWSIRGVPVEVMCSLANRLGVDAWFSIPWTVDDEYVRLFARSVGRLLDPKLRAYVEYSNEVWNAEYPQTRHAQTQGAALGLGDRARPWESGGMYHARRSTEIMTLCEQEIPAPRLVRVLAWQAAGPWWFENILLKTGEAAAHHDALAIAPYFGGYLGNARNQAAVQTPGLTLDALFAELSSRAVPQAVDVVQQMARYAASKGKTLIAYEGGQHLVGVGAWQNDEALNRLFDQANRDPRMGGLYDRYLQGWREAGAGLFCNFIHCDAYSKYGRFGMLEYLSQPPEQSPKLLAVRRAMR
ncbi:MAG: hypothetical protein HZB16_10375 [Armatimonadetes bacterium]|nr:hypothetical protein [Armatimonadota bacterium]